MSKKPGKAEKANKIKRVRIGRATLYCGNSLKALPLIEKKIAEAGGLGYHSCVTDPPYDLTNGKKGGSGEKSVNLKHPAPGRSRITTGGFMGAEWDATGIAFREDLWRHVQAALRPGAFVLAFGGTRTFHKMTTAIDNSGMEIRDQIAWVYGCYSEDTECLTDRGWLPYSSLTKKHKVLQWDSTSGCLEWVRPSRILVYRAPNTMVHIQNRHTDQLVTLNHRVYAKLRRHSRDPRPESYEVIQAGDIKSNWAKTIPMAGYLKGEITEPDAYIIGWWLTDAWPHANKDACMFTQSKPKALKCLRKALQESDCSFSESIRKAKSESHRREHVFYVKGALAAMLRRRFPRRRLTIPMLSQWDYASRHSLLEGLLDGDGSRPGSHAETFWSKKKSRLDFVQALCVSLNIRCYADYEKGALYINRRGNSTQVNSRHTLEVVPYEGSKVWCLTVPSGAFVVRRNGKPFISGNSGFPHGMNIALTVDKKLRGRPQGTADPTSPNHKRLLNRGDVRSAGAGASGFSKDFKNVEARGKDVSKLHPDAQEFEGFNTAIKPAFEPICVARTQMRLSATDNMMKFHTGAFNIGACRIELKQADGNLKKGIKAKGGKMATGDADTNWGFKRVDREAGLGRYPANLVHDGSDDVLALFPSTGKSSGGKGAASTGFNGNVYGSYSGSKHGQNAGGLGDHGSAARFFYCAKSGPKDRNYGMDGVEAKPFVQFQTANGTSGKASGKASSLSAGHKKTAYKNIHPTVKPIALMRWLVNLATWPGGTVLDPFMGSGSTGIAAILEGHRFVGIEQDPTYFEIACRRIAKAVEEREALEAAMSKAAKDGVIAAPKKKKPAKKRASVRIKTRKTVERHAAT